MTRVAQISRDSAYYARERFQKAFSGKSGIAVAPGELLNEICLLFNNKNALLAEEFWANAGKAGMIAGSKVLVPAESGFIAGIAMAFTETHKKEQIDKLVECLPTAHIQ
jgi:glycine cleavage system pyridoxal-binding protein P